MKITRELRNIITKYSVKESPQREFFLFAGILYTLFKYAISEALFIRHIFSPSRNAGSVPECIRSYIKFRDIPRISLASLIVKTSG
jgi:hypothetical protein